MPHKLWYLITVAPMSSVVAVDLQQSQYVKAALQSQATRPEAGSEQYDRENRALELGHGGIK
jgi:hypothetical protein